VARALIALSHRSLATLGLVVVSIAILTLSHDQFRTEVEHKTLGWLMERKVARTAAEPELTDVMNIEPAAVDRATATDPAQLDQQQAAVAKWLSKRYKVAPEPVSRLVQEAWKLGQRDSLEPTLILAVMAVESGFNPFAQSAVGAQGLMQVMTRVHDEKYVAFGGHRAAFDPLANLRVGVRVLKECILKAGGSLPGGLRRYVGATRQTTDDGGYAIRVMTEQRFLHQVASGKSVPVQARLPLSDEKQARSAASPAPTPAG
jgi:soluble lytic murein transglycosylase-like protein